MRPPGPERAAAKGRLLRTVLWYGILSLFLIGVWALSGRGYFWPAWPILGFMLLLAWQATGIWSRLGALRRRPAPPRGR
jgi:2TM domain